MINKIVIHCADTFADGYNKAITEFAEKALVQLQEKEAKRQVVEKDLLQVNIDLETEKAKKKQVIKEVTRDVIQYVQVPDRTQCKFEIRGGDLFRDPRAHGQINVKQGYGAKNSCHKLKLAINLNLFKDGAFIQTTEGHRELGEWWEKQHELCRWGFFVLQYSISRYCTSAFPSTHA